MSIGIVTCSRIAGDAFEMAKTFADVLDPDTLGNVQLFEAVGATSMALGFNAQMQIALSRPYIKHLFFTHGDVRNMASVYAFNRMFGHMMEEPHPGFYGVAGSTYLGPQGHWWGEREKTLGSIAHEVNNHLYQTVFHQGMFEKEALVMDGVFLAATREALDGFIWEGTG